MTSEELVTFAQALGVVVCLVGAFLMGWGESILGENHAGIATILGIVGIGMIAKARRGEA